MRAPPFPSRWTLAGSLRRLAMPSLTHERLSRRRERAARLVDLADTLEASADDHDPATARLLQHLANRLVCRAEDLVPEDYPSADDSLDQLTL